MNLKHIKNKYPDNLEQGKLLFLQEREHSHVLSCSNTLCLSLPPMLPQVLMEGKTNSTAFETRMVSQGRQIQSSLAHYIPCLRAPSPARMKEISLESTMWCAPSCRTKRSPDSLCPERGPFSQASKNP